MAKVDWITWKTDVNEIINPEKVLEELLTKQEDYQVYMNSVVTENIQYEMKVGGLERNALSLLGDSPAYEKAQEILKRIENIKELIEEMTKEVVLASIEQKKIEKNQLIECIEEKIAEEKNIQKNTLALKERLQGNNSYITEQEVEDILEVTNDRLQRLEERLEIAKSI